MGTLLTSFGGVRSSTRMEYARLNSTHDHQRVYHGGGFPIRYRFFRHPHPSSPRASRAKADGSGTKLTNVELLAGTKAPPLTEISVKISKKLSIWKLPLPLSAVTVVWPNDATARYRTSETASDSSFAPRSLGKGNEM